MLAFDVVRLDFDPTSRREQVLPGVAQFNSRVNTAQAALQSFDVGYTDGDHHILRHKIQIEGVQRSGNNVNFQVRFLFRDSSGNIDDRFDGVVDILVIADVA